MYSSGNNVTPLLHNNYTKAYYLLSIAITTMANHFLQPLYLASHFGALLARPIKCMIDISFILCTYTYQCIAIHSSIFLDNDSYVLALQMYTL